MFVIIFHAVVLFAVALSFVARVVGIVLVASPGTLSSALCLCIFIISVEGDFWF